MPKLCHGCGKEFTPRRKSPLGRKGDARMMKGDDFACRPVHGGWSPVIFFKGQRYQWASVYETPQAASSVAQQLLASAVKHGRVP